jgi:hypothetical protein
MLNGFGKWSETLKLSKGMSLAVRQQLDVGIGDEQAVPQRSGG